MQIAGFATGPYQTNCYIVINEGTAEGFVVDPGMGAAPQVREAFEQQNAKLTAVILTHGHLDHTRDAAELGAPVYIHEADDFMLDGGGGLPANSRLLFNAESMKRPDEVHFLYDAAPLTLAGHSFAVHHAPGHSPGSVLLVEEEAGLVFSGDVLFRGSVGRTDLVGSDPNQMLESLRGPVWELDDALAVLPGHGPTTTVAHERATNPYLLDANRGR